MKSVLREHGGEALVGLLVVLFAAWFSWFAWGRTGGHGGADATRVTAYFPNASGVNVGTDVRVAGLKVGSVVAQKLDPKSFQVETTLSIDPKVKLPSDSSAAITSEGLLGSTYIALLPGGSSTPLKTGDAIFDTQGAIDMMGMIGQFINKTGTDTPGGGNAASTPDSMGGASAPTP
ncbi:MAG TPA: outer membrane lipid asymmetry maintenance protein MlaD [Sphingomonadaceae bacterium]|jgi:phospholipid/cholesterol/gamma-HCH transport system substrate-binding protein|nr:outer membrane lipid asymmetry maintenance protein MlaD [Sphingomonadaceae bacterium]